MKTEQYEALLKTPRQSRRAAPPASGLKEEIAAKARELGAALVGIAPVSRWDDAGEVPPDYRPKAIWAGAQSVIVVGVPMLLPVIESTPSINYQEMYDTSNRLLDAISYQLAAWLTQQEGLDAARAVSAVAASARSQDGQPRQARVHPGLTAYGDVR